MGYTAGVITALGPVVIPGDLDLIGFNLPLMGGIGIPATWVMSLIWQSDVLDHHRRSITALQAIAHDLAVTAPERLNIFDMKDRFSTCRLSYYFLEIQTHLMFMVISKHMPKIQSVESQ